MPRPRKCRLVGEGPKAVYFKPQGIPLSRLQEVVLPVEGLEALRLAEVLQLDQDAAAQLMGVSRPTFSRVLAQARRQVSLALVHGWAMRIDGGDYSLASPEPPASQTAALQDEENAQKGVGDIGNHSRRRIMPAKDGTGPDGQGPRGRGRGPCQGRGQSGGDTRGGGGGQGGNDNQGPGRGQGRGQGRGRGKGRQGQA